MKSILTIILSLWCVLSLHAGDVSGSPLSNSDENIEIDGAYYVIINDNEVSLSQVSTNVGTEFTIPVTIEYEGMEYTVTDIAQAAFFFNSRIKIVNIPATVKSIGAKAFSSCSSLSYIYFYDDLIEENTSTGLVSIGESAFNGCTALRYFSIPASCSEIGKAAFAWCIKLKEIELPATMTEIPESMLNNCQSLTSISLPDGIQTIGSSAFYGCKVLSDINMPQSLAGIEQYAFRGCVALKSVVFPQTLRKLGDSSFFQCTGLTKVVFPDEISTLENGVFSGCTALKEVVFPKNISRIPDEMFYDCKSLENPVFYNNIGHIGYYAFSGCESLTEFSVPTVSVVVGVNSLKIKEYAFRDCINLKTVTLPVYTTEVEFDAFSGCSGIKDVYSYAAEAFEPVIMESAFDVVAPGSTLHIPRTLKSRYTDWIPRFDNVEYMGLNSVSLAETEITFAVGEQCDLQPQYDTIGDIFCFHQWSMSNPQIATIDYDGKLTAVAEGETTVTIKAEDLYYDVCYAECKVSVTAASGIENVDADVIETEYFDLKGLRVNPDNLTPGVYIRRQGAATSKVVVK